MLSAIEHDDDLVIGTEKGYLCIFSLEDFSPLAKQKLKRSATALGSFARNLLVVGMESGWLAAVVTWGSELQIKCQTQFDEIGDISSVEVTSQEDLLVASKKGLFVVNYADGKGFEIKY